MGKGLTDRDSAIVQKIILDRWNPLRLNKRIASHFGLTINLVRQIRSKSAFQTEYKRQLAIYQSSFEEIQLADRKERVTAMQDLYDKIPDTRVALILVPHGFEVQHLYGGRDSACEPAYAPQEGSVAPGEPGGQQSRNSGGPAS